MKILAIEFSSTRRSVAIVECQAGFRTDVLGAASEMADRSTRAFALIEEALRQGRIEREAIECLSIGIGPGSYTGIRAAISIAQGWQVAREIKIAGVSSAECLAHQARDEKIHGSVAIVVDAQRKEFYLATYAIDESAVREVEPLHLITRGEIERRIGAGEIVLGPGARKCLAGARDLYPDAVAVGRIACSRTVFVRGETIEPIYLREAKFVKAPPPSIIPDF